MKRPGKGSLLDTNVLVRFLLGDDHDQSQRAYELVRRLEEEKEAADLEESVLAETVWVLEKGFHVPRAEIARRLTSFIQIPGVRCRSKRVALEALGRFSSTKCDIVDCLLAARARSRRTQVYSFDEDFDKLGCAWKEPP